MPERPVEIVHVKLESDKETHREIPLHDEVYPETERHSLTEVGCESVNGEKYVACDTRFGGSDVVAVV